MLELRNVNISGEPSTHQELKSFQSILGTTTCTNNLIARIVKLFALSFVATFIYILLEIPPVDCWFAYYIPDYEYRFFSKALLFFTLIYIADTLTSYLRADIDICDFDTF